jgi:hypothetical protein
MFSKILMGNAGLKQVMGDNVNKVEGRAIICLGTCRKG